jgi:putative oxidoreductase
VGYISSAGLPLPQVGAAIAVAVELGVGLMLLAGFKTRVAAIVLAVFTVAAGLFFHNFWAMPADKVYVNQLMFMKNLAIAGGLLAFAALGAGRFSIDKR